MKRAITISFFCLLEFLLYPFRGRGQEIPITTEQQLENQADIDPSGTEDDNYLQELEQFRKNPVNLNLAEAEELKLLRIINDLQIENLILYRNLIGKLISIFELQAVPAWDISTIKKLLPFVTVLIPVPATEEFRKRFNHREHSLLLRVSQTIERSKGFEMLTAGTKYSGSPQRVMFRYKYVYKNLLQFGFVADKDAGEQFFKGAQDRGFDFYSFHLFARKIGIIQSAALGDFTVNMGQGLIQWQSLAFKKSAEVTGIKRQSAILRPYNSTGEFYFNRGAGITIKKGKTEATIFASVRKLSANFTTDTVSHKDFISSFLNSGYHRTINENADRNNLTQTSFGGNVNYRSRRWHTGVNGVYYNFSLPVQKQEEPYNLYAFSGQNWWNYSLDYSYTYKNVHFFGEAAADKNFHSAFTNGLLISVDPRVDLSLLQRTIAKEYQAVYGNAFTENTYPTNEVGFFTGITIRPAIGWRLDAYADLYKFSWLKNLVDAPSHGKDFLAQVTYTPNKQLEIYSRFMNETKQLNQSDNTTVTNFLVSIPKQNWRTQLSYQINPSITVRNRIELVWYDHVGSNKENGFLFFGDLMYKPILKPFSCVLRMQYFETDGYDSRVYAYENDILYSYSIPAFFDKGVRYYININCDVRKNFSFWLRWAQTIYRDKYLIGSGPDEIKGNKKSEINILAYYIF